MELVFKTEVYEGPLDLLLALIAKNKMNIADIKIAVIFDQYMEYVENMEIEDMEVAGDFIRMASELMLIKSKMLLPSASEQISIRSSSKSSIVAASFRYQRPRLPERVISE